MATELITVRNTLNGNIALVHPRILDNPHLAKHLVEVPDEKPKNMKLAAPTTAEEFLARRGAEVVEPETDLTIEDNYYETEEG